MTDLFKLLQPLQFLESYLAKNFRPDGRGFEEFRKVMLVPNPVSSSNGSALVKLGNSSVIVGIQASVVAPPTERPDQGILDINVKFSNVCTIEMDNFDRAVVSDYVRECLKKVFQHAKVIDLASLCIISGKHVWRLEMEVICLNFNGGLLDMSLLGSVAALRQCRLKLYKIDDELDLITPTKDFVPLRILCYPQFISFVAVKSFLLVDPTTTEEELAESIVRIAVDPTTCSKKQSSDDSIYFLEVTGSIPLERSIVERCHVLAMERARYLHDLILGQALEGDTATASCHPAKSDKMDI